MWLPIRAAISVTIEGTREACDQARRVLETLYEQLRNGGDLVVGDVDGAIRQAMAQGSLFDGEPAGERRILPTSRCASAPCAPAPPDRTPIFAR